MQNHRHAHTHTRTHARTQTLVANDRLNARTVHGQHSARPTIGSELPLRHTHTHTHSKDDGPVPHSKKPAGPRPRWSAMRVLRSSSRRPANDQFGSATESAHAMRCGSVYPATGDIQFNQRVFFAARCGCLLFVRRTEHCGCDAANERTNERTHAQKMTWLRNQAEHTHIFGGFETEL